MPFIFLLALAACAPTAQIIVPTDPPSPSPSLTPSASRTGNAVLPTFTPVTLVRDPAAPTGTPPSGASRTPLPHDLPTPTRAFNPSAPRMDVFTHHPISVAPSQQV